MLLKIKIEFVVAAAFIFLSQQSFAQSNSTIVKKGAKYDTIIRKHVDKPVVKKTVKPTATQPVKQEVIIPVPEFINQPYYYDSINNQLVKLENATAQMITKKKTLGLKGAKQFLSMDAVSSRVRFTSRNNIIFIIKTSGDVIDLTSYIKLYQFIPEDQKREVTINSKEGMLSDKEEGKGRIVNFSVKMISKDNYMMQLPEQLEAGEYGFVWVKNLELKEFSVFAFGVDWKSSN